VPQDTNLNLNFDIAMQRLEYNVNVSSALFYLSSVVLVLFTINYCWKRRRLYYYSSKLKGPLALPFLGSIHEFAGGIDCKANLINY
jgi:hypothetical protein